MWQEAEELIEKTYRGKWYRTGLSKAQTGLAGGLYSVLKDIAEQWGQNLANEIIERTVEDMFDNRYSSEEYEKAAEVFFEKYHKFVPQELKDAGNYKFLLKFNQVLKKYPHTIRKIRNASS